MHGKFSNAEYSTFYILPKNSTSMIDIPGSGNATYILPRIHLNISIIFCFIFKSLQHLVSAVYTETSFQIYFILLLNVIIVIAFWKLYNTKEDCSLVL